MSNFYGDTTRVITELPIDADKPQKSDDEIYVCQECGSQELTREAIVDYNTREFIEFIGAADDWCNDCECETTVVSLAEYKKDNLTTTKDGE